MPSEASSSSFASVPPGGFEEHSRAVYSAFTANLAAIGKRENAEIAKHEKKSKRSCHAALVQIQGMLGGLDHDDDDEYD